MALAGTRSTSGSKINSKEDSMYNSHSHSVMDQKETTNGYSIRYTLGHGEAFTKEDPVSDSISNLLSNTYTTEKGWSYGDSESTTKFNGRTFGNSCSNSIMNDITMEEAKNKVKSKFVSYQIRQSISDQPDDNGCYSYEVTPNIFTRSYLKFYTSKYSKYERNKYIINKTGYSYNEYSRNFRIFREWHLQLKDGYSTDILTAPSPISSFEASINYSGSYTSTINSNSDPNIRKLYAVTLKFQFQKDINAHLLNVQLKIAKNSHLIMMANNILANKNVENDDEYKVGITQELIIWDSLPGSLPFNVGSLREYWLHIITLYDGLLSPILKIQPINPDDDDV
ncbi:hypothetical protein U3516DRAFT_735128 [Neocallimastix sp. 'constans']